MFVLSPGEPLTVSLLIRIFISVNLALLASCHDQDGDFARPREKRDQPVELVLLDDGRPHPAVLASDQTVTRGNGEEPETLDPHRAESVPSANILRDLFEGLTTEAPDGEIIPGAAIRWNISRDAATYTFYLRRDMRWSNGDPLIADDFVYSLRRAASPETASPSASMLLPIQNAREVLAGELPVESLGIVLLDEYTLQITLTGPTPYFLGLLTHPVAYPVNRSNLEEFGDQFSRPGKLVSNGAYILKSWEHRVSIELEKNPLFREAESTLIKHAIFLPLEDVSVASGTTTPAVFVNAKSSFYWTNTTHAADTLKAWLNYTSGASTTKMAAFAKSSAQYVRPCRGGRVNG